jgi:hypothetical protein
MVSILDLQRMQMEDPMAMARNPMAMVRYSMAHPGPIAGASLPVMQMASAQPSVRGDFEPAAGSAMEAKSRNSIDSIISHMAEQRSADRQNDRNMQWMSFFSKLASTKSPTLMGALGEGADALTETTGKQAQSNKLLDRAEMEDRLKYEQWKEEQNLKKEENASQAELRAAQADYYKNRPSSASGGTADVKAQRYMDEMAALGTPVTYIQALAATSSPGLKNAVTNTAGLPQYIADAEVGINNIDMMIGNDSKGIKEHPGLTGAVGPISSKLLTISDDVADFETRAKQATGGAFLDAYNTLRGGGAITEVEGEKATAARSRMLLATSEKAFREAAKEYRSYIIKGIERAKEKSGVLDGNPQPEAPRSDVPKQDRATALRAALARKKQ